MGVIVLVASVAFSLYQSRKTSDEAKSASAKAAALSIKTRQLAKENARLLEKQQRETAHRRDQSCRGYELQHRQEVIELRRTFRFYENPPPSFAELLKEPLVIQQLKERVRDAAKDQDQFGVFVPPVCDLPGYGRPEPDPKVPKTPPMVQSLLQAPAG